MRNHQIVSIWFGLFTVALLVAGCAQIPQKEFTSYKEAFNNARSAGEQVLLDFGTALKEVQSDLESRQSKDNTQESKHEAPREFKASKIAGGDQAREVVLVRMRAWEVVARYNDVLTGLAEGKSAAELTAAADGLFQSLSSFPIGEIAETAGSLAPFMGVLKTLIGMAAEERSRQDFIKLVDTGAPLIQDTFLKLLSDDSIRFYEVRKKLNDDLFDILGDELTDLADNFYTLMKEYKRTPSLELVTAKAKAVLDEFKMSEGMEVNKNARKILTPLVESQLEDILSNMKMKSTAMKATRAELFAYYQMLSAYVVLLDKVAATLDDLALAAKNTTVSLPPINDLVGVYIDLQQAFETYRTAQRSAL